MLKQEYTIHEFRNLQAAGTMKVGKKLTMHKVSKEKQYIQGAIMHSGFDYEMEYQFSPDRKYRSDWFIPSLKLLIEYEGLIFSNNQKGSTGKSGHTTVSGYTSNADKYNLATVLGFRLLRYTAMNYKQIGPDIRLLMKLPNL